MFGLGEKTQDEPAAVEKLTVDENNRISQSFMAALNKVISAQSSIIIGYVERLKKSNKND